MWPSPPSSTAPKTAQESPVKGGFLSAYPPTAAPFRPKEGGGPPPVAAAAATTAPVPSKFFSQNTYRRLVLKTVFLLTRRHR